MKKYFVLGLIILTGIGNGWGQTVQTKESLSVNIGPSLSVGNFGTHKLTNNGAGFAGTGAALSFQYQRRIGKRLGFSASFQGQFNPLAVSSLENSFNDLLIADIVVWTGTTPGQIPPPVVTGTRYTNWSYEKKSWWTGSLLLGVYGEFPINPDSTISFMASMGIGPTYVSAPSIKGQSIGATASAYHDQSGGTTWGVAYDVNIGLRKYVNKKWFLQFQVSHFAAPSLKFKNIKASLTTTKGVYGQPDFSVSNMTSTGTGEQNLQSLNIGFGAGFRF